VLSMDDLDDIDNALNAVYTSSQLGSVFSCRPGRHQEKTSWAGRRWAGTARRTNMSTCHGRDLDGTTGSDSDIITASSTPSKLGQQRKSLQVHSKVSRLIFNGGGL
jgi:hypothetical protein